MRSDNSDFLEYNGSTSKEPRYTIEISFDDDNTDLYYFTSHADSATPAAATVIASVIESLSVISQNIKPEKALATIGSISFKAVDIGNAIRSAQASELAFGNSLKNKRVRVYFGYKGQLWANYILIQTQVIDEVSYLDGAYTFKCSDVQRLERKDIFDLARTTLANTLTDSETTVTVYTTDANELMKHSSLWTDAPSSTVGYIKIEDEIIRFTGKTSTTFTGCTRGVLDTKAVLHTVDAADAADRRTEVDEYVYLELPAPKLAYAILTGIIHNESATMPTSWHLGIKTEFVRLSDFTGVGSDLWDTDTESLSFILRFAGEKKQDGKKFIEEQINLACACFNIIYSTGELGFRRMTHIISDAQHVLELNEDNVVSYGDLTHDMDGVENHLVFQWNYQATKKQYTRRNILLDSQSITLHGQSDPKTLKFRGIHGSVHTAETIATIFDSLRDRFSSPPLKISVTVRFSSNALEVGDVVRLVLPQVNDYNTDASIDRAFEVQKISVDWVNGSVKLLLFGSAAKAGVIARPTTTTVLSDAYYIQEGNNLKTYVGGGYDATTDYSSNAITTSCQLTGGSNLKNSSSIYYHDGDLTINVGVTLTITDNVQLRVKGVLTVNGEIDGKGLGVATASTSGYAGTAKAQGGTVRGDGFLRSTEAAVTSGSKSAVTGLFLDYDGGNEILSGIPTNLRGTTGGKGGDDTFSGTLLWTGGTHGSSGAGLFIISRGLFFGVTGSIDLSGNDGVTGAGNIIVSAGAGAGGGAGALYIILDGSAANATIISGNFIAKRGASPPNAPAALSPTEWLGNGSSYYVGLPDTDSWISSHSVQYIPDDVEEEQDEPELLLTAPTSLTAASGTAHLLTEPDGTIVPRVLLTFVSAIDSRIAGYEVQFKTSAGSLWTSATNILGADSTQTYVLGVTSTVDYDFRVRSAGLGITSTWITVNNHAVLGKTALPSDVTTFDVYQNGSALVMKWFPVSDVDLSGYEIRYIESDGSGLWIDGTVLTAVTKGTNVTTVDIPDGTWLMMIKAVDTTGNYSVNAKTRTVIFSSDFDIINTASFSPSFAGTLTNMVRHYTGKIVPKSQNLASSDGFDTFDISVINPFTDCYYEVAEYDNGFDDESRISGIITSYLAPTETTGSASPTFEIDYRLAADSYDGFELWSAGNANFRYLKARVHVDTSIGVAIVSEFVRVVDAIEFTQKAESAAIGSSGTTITFPVPFHNVPFIDVLVISSTALLVTVSAKSATQFTINLFNTGGTQVSGTVDWKAIGV